MLTRIRQLLAPPVFEDDEDKTRVAGLLNIILLSILAIATSVGLVGPFVLPDPVITIAVTGTMVPLCLAALFLMHRGHVRVASVIVVGEQWLAYTVLIVFAGGMSSIFSVGYLTATVIAALLLGGPAAWALTALSILTGLGIVYAESIDFLPTPILAFGAGPAWLALAANLIATTVTLYLAARSLNEALRRARDYAVEVETQRESLEKTVDERTQHLQRRTRQWQAATEAGRAITSILEPQQLLWRVAELIQARFDLYHVGLFQLDATGQWADYGAGAGEGGRLLAEQGFRLQVGGASVVGWCTAHAQAHVVQDVREEAGRVDHPLVPDTRSEAALPLVTRGQVIGALSVQSSQTGAFDPETIATLQALADQVAVALDNARLFTESQEALQATRRAYGELSRQAWLELLRARPDWGYSFTGQSIEPAKGDWQPEMSQALQKGDTVLRSPEHTGDGDNPEEPVLAIPLTVRDEVVGVLGFYKDTEAEGQPEAGPAGWTPEEARLLERLVGQMGLALESAQFYEESQRRALREQTAREITARMRETLDMDAVLRTAAQEARRALGLPEVVVRLRGAASALEVAPLASEAQDEIE